MKENREWIIIQNLLIKQITINDLKSNNWKDISISNYVIIFGKQLYDAFKCIDWDLNNDSIITIDNNNLLLKIIDCFKTYLTIISKYDEDMKIQNIQMFYFNFKNFKQLNSEVKIIELFRELLFSYLILDDANSSLLGSNNLARLMSVLFDNDFNLLMDLFDNKKHKQNNVVYLSQFKKEIIHNEI